MNEQPPTKYQIFRYDPEKDEVVLVREGVAEPVDPSTLSPKLQKILADARKQGERFEQELKEQAKRKSA